MLEDLLGRDVQVTLADPVVAGDLPDSVIAVYVGPNTQLAAVLGLSLPLAAYAGAALGLLPAGTAEDSIEDKLLSPMLGENIRELCNIFSVLLNPEDAPHVRLHQVFEPGQKPPSDARAQLLAFGYRLDLTVEVARYGAGLLSLSLAV